MRGGTGESEVVGGFYWTERGSGWRGPGGKMGDWIPGDREEGTGWGGEGEGEVQGTLGVRKKGSGGGGEGRTGGPVE